MLGERDDSLASYWLDLGVPVLQTANPRDCDFVQRYFGVTDLRLTLTLLWDHYAVVTATDYRC